MVTLSEAPAPIEFAECSAIRGIFGQNENLPRLAVGLTADAIYKAHAKFARKVAGFIAAKHGS